MRYSVVALLLLLSIAACSSDLSRDEAAKLLDTSDAFTPAKSYNQEADGKPDINGCIWPKEKFHRRKVLKVTGITGEGDRRIVEFRWVWDTDPESMKCVKLLPDWNVGKASFRRYDDGWRVVEIDAEG